MKKKAAPKAPAKPKGKAAVNTKMVKNKTPSKDVKADSFVRG